MKLKYSILAASLLGMAAVNGATVAWSSGAFTTSGGIGATLDAGQFATDGTEILAENIGGGALTFDGINFAAGTVVFAGGTAAVFHENIPTANTLLAREGTYGVDGAADTVSLSGLTIGNTYRIQALVYDGRGDAGITGRTIEFDGLNQNQYANGVSGSTWGDGLLVTGTFVADATTQDFTVEAFTGATSKGGQLNALLVHETAVVPEPTTTALLGLGGLALILRRRK
ncbi:PEP-CTERM sorting domain-containing protein [Verrucomicrobiaceae bacterium N1E253]|uniref:PEP-CTERM sorting domain-containing protein n=1 Tax=Oceaniferula marina TaxID=2748318 RepID=A0A851GQ54_9BACT|nr:PEP-CTERM sorting domain-containing protein [Oceaniferula marina]NWK56284.1 PEP-CTERM sorting domain-containing protein [Oceaniferula marina]